MNSLSLRVFSSYLFVICVFFPWVSFRTNSMDTQPWAFICSLVFLLSCLDLKVSKTIYVVWFIPVVACSLFFIDHNGDASLFIRGFFSYLFFVSVFVASYYLFRFCPFPLKFLVFINLLYLIVGIIQMSLGPYVFDFLAPVRTTESRGVTSLAVEPTNFGLTLLVFSWIYYIYHDYKLNNTYQILVLSNFLGVLFVAQSSLAICFVLLAIFMFIIYKVSVKTFFYTLIISSLGLFGTDFLIYHYPEARMSKLFNILSNIGFLELLLRDASFNYRVSSLIFPYQGFVKNIFMPGGFTSFELMAQDLMFNSHGLFWYGEHAKIMSFIGAFIYELGFVGFIFLMCYFFCIHNKFQRYRSALESLFLFLLLNMAVPIASPIIAFLLSFILYRRNDGYVFNNKLN